MIGLPTSWLADVQRCLGSCLCGHPAKTMVWLVGAGDSGKDTALRHLLTEPMGQLATTLSHQCLTQGTSGSGHTEHIAALAGHRYRRGYGLVIMIMCLAVQVCSGLRGGGWLYQLVCREAVDWYDSYFNTESRLTACI
jgi:hypothetical protein